MINEEKHIKQSYALCSCSVKSVGIGDNYQRYDRSNLITDYASGELVCNKCGTVVCDTFEESNRKEALEAIGEKKKLGVMTGKPISLSTIIATSGRDANGQKLDMRMRMRFKKLSLWDSRIDIHSDLKPQVSLQLSRLKDKLGLSNAILEKSTYIYRKAHQRFDTWENIRWHFSSVYVHGLQGIWQY